MLLFVIIFAIIIVSAIPLSMLFNSMRRVPTAPEQIVWAPDIPIRSVQVNNLRIRYIKTGTGPPMVLLHTLRTHLDLFQKLVPELASTHTVYVLDYPGHGWSDIPNTEYTPEFFAGAVKGFVDELNLSNTILVGESIGGTIPLMLAADDDARLHSIVSINPYDYRRRFTLNTWFITRFSFWLGAIPILGETFMRFRLPLIESWIMQGGVVNKDSLPSAYLQDMYSCGCRPHHYRGFVSILRNLFKWNEQQSNYSKIKVPVLLVYGDQDWSHESDRQQTAQAIPNSMLVTVENAGHFMTMDRPEPLLQHIQEFVGDNASA